MEVTYTEIPNTGGRYYINEFKDVWNAQLQKHSPHIILFDEVPRVCLSLNGVMKFYELDYLFNLTFGDKANEKEENTNE